MRNLSPRQLADLLASGQGDSSAASASPGPLLLDVREPWEYAICHLPGSRLVPMGSLPDAVQGLDPRRETVVICHHGIRSLQVARWLERQGFGAVLNLEGGLDAWARDLDPGMRTY